MIHLTLNTGHSMSVPPEKILPTTIRTLTPMVVKGGDLIPHFSPWRTVMGKGDGYASFDIRRNQTDIVTLNVVAWTEIGAKSAWEILEKHYLAAADALAKNGIAMELEMPEMPEPLPWLASWILPSAIQAMHPKEIGWMSDFEQCFAATILNRYEKNER
jgi:hypothetical protein